MRTVLKTPPSVLPLTLNDIKNYCRILGNDEDGLLNALQVSAVEAFEMFTGRKLAEQVYEIYASDAQKLVLPYSPVKNIVIEQKVESGFETFDNYKIVWDYDVAHVIFPQNVTVKITLTVGYNKIPADILLWLKAKIATLYEHRENISNTSILELPKTHIEYILKMYKVRYV
jgi:uncharacterized phiE125 gp8 family phage protein